MDSLQQSKEMKVMGLPGHSSTSSPRPNIHATKVMLCVRLDQGGVIYFELLKSSEIITSINTIEPRSAIETPTIRGEARKVILQHDNARPHVAKTFTEMLL